MKILINHFKFSKQKILRKLKFNVIAENQQESTLDKLPALLELIESSGLNSYSINLLINKYGRFDLEIDSFTTQVLSIHQDKARSDVVVVNIAGKIERLFHHLYEKPSENGKLIAYDQFVNSLSKYHPLYSAWSDQQLASKNQLWQQLDRVYEFKKFAPQVRKDKYHEILNNKNSDNRFFKTYAAQCPFDNNKIVSEQRVFDNEYFRISFNHMPVGDTPLHFMIIPTSHTANLITATSRQLFELELLLKVIIELISTSTKCKSNDVKIYLQKHAAGMTVNHLHVHVLMAPEFSKFRDDIMQQMRSIACHVAKLSEAKQFLKSPLSVSKMQAMRADLSPTIKNLIEKNYTSLLQKKVIHPSYSIEKGGEEESRSHQRSSSTVQLRQ